MKVQIITIVFILFCVAFISGCATSENNNNVQKTADGKIMCDGPPCLGQYFPSCTPAETTMSSGEQSVIVTIHGFENEKCHFTMVFGDITAADCYFKQENLNDKVLNQMFGNQEGQDEIISEACNQ